MKTKQKILTLNLKSCWYDLIEQGIKKEEYREIKPYWSKRLLDENGESKKFDAVKFVYGYTKRTMMFKIDSIKIGAGKTEWGADPFLKYYVIKLGEKI